MSERVRALWVQRRLGCIESSYLSVRTRPAVTAIDRLSRGCIAASAKIKPAKKPPFPGTLAEQAAAVRAALAARQSPASAEELARAFSRANVTRVRELLDALRTLGQVRQVDADRFAA